MENKLSFTNFREKIIHYITIQNNYLFPYISWVCDQLEIKIRSKAFQEYSFHFVAKNFILAAHVLAVDAQSITETTLWLKEFPFVKDVKDTAVTTAVIAEDSS